VALGDADNGKVITVGRGSTMTVTLSTTSWKFAVSEDHQVISQEGQTSTHPANNCVPGVQCGTTTAMFAAVASGHAAITATRTYCGEAVRCTPDNDSWKVAVTVE
jgi:predicted secreted protein